MRESSLLHHERPPFASRMEDKVSTAERQPTPGAPYETVDFLVRPSQDVLDAAVHGALAPLHIRVGDDPFLESDVEQAVGMALRASLTAERVEIVRLAPVTLRPVHVGGVRDPNLAAHAQAWAAQNAVTALAEAYDLVEREATGVLEGLRRLQADKKAEFEATPRAKKRFESPPYFRLSTPDAKLAILATRFHASTLRQSYREDRLASDRFIQLRPLLFGLLIGSIAYGFLTDALGDVRPSWLPELLYAMLFAVVGWLLGVGLEKWSSRRAARRWIEVIRAGALNLAEAYVYERWVLAVLSCGLESGDVSVADIASLSLNLEDPDGRDNGHPTPKRFMAAAWKTHRPLLESSLEPHMSFTHRSLAPKRPAPPV